MERGLYSCEATDVLGVFCRMVTSSVVGSGVPSHSTWVKGNAFCFCVFGGGVGEVGVGFRADDGGESSVFPFYLGQGQGLLSLLPWWWGRRDEGATRAVGIVS